RRTTEGTSDAAPDLEAAAQLLYPSAGITRPGRRNLLSRRGLGRSPLRGRAASSWWRPREPGGCLSLAAVAIRCMDSASALVQRCSSTRYVKDRIGSGVFLQSPNCFDGRKNEQLNVAAFCFTFHFFHHR